MKSFSFVSLLLLLICLPHVVLSVGSSGEFTLAPIPASPETCLALKEHKVRFSNKGTDWEITLYMRSYKRVGDKLYPTVIRLGKLKAGESAIYNVLTLIDNSDLTVEFSTCVVFNTLSVACSKINCGRALLPLDGRSTCRTVFTGLCGHHAAVAETFYESTASVEDPALTVNIYPGREGCPQESAGSRLESPLRLLKFW